MEYTKRQVIIAIEISKSLDYSIYPEENICSIECKKELEKDFSEYLKESGLTVQTKDLDEKNKIITIPPPWNTLDQLILEFSTSRCVLPEYSTYQSNS